jgi:hypothetical protein
MENKKPTELKFKFKNKEVTKPTQKTLDECKNWEYRIEGEYMVKWFTNNFYCYIMTSHC